jgi:predicted porin
MFRSLFAATLAVLALVSSLEARAQTAMLYGLIDASGSHTKPVGGDAQWLLNSGDMTQSFLGFRGNEDLGGGLRAVWKLESYIRVDSGADGRFGSDTFWSRESNVGLSGDFGTTVLGRNVTPLYNATVNFNPFGESMTFSPSARQYFGNSGVGGAVLGDRTWSNSIAYNNSATQSPLRINVIANAEEESPGQLSTGRNYGGSLAYITGPFAATVAFERIKNSGLSLPSGFDRQVAYQAGATYDFKVVRIYGQIGRVKTESDVDAATVLYQLGAAVPFGTSLILISYGSAQTRTPYSQITDRIASLGYDYYLSKHTDIYVAASYEKTFRLSSGNALAGGVRLRF